MSGSFDFTAYKTAMERSGMIVTEDHSDHLFTITVISGTGCYAGQGPTKHDAIMDLLRSWEKS